MKVDVPLNKEKETKTEQVVVKATENWKVEFAAGVQTLAVVKNPKKYLPRRITRYTTICYNKDVI